MNETSIQNKPTMDTVELTERQIEFVQYMLKGYGFDAKPSQLTASERKDFDFLVENNLASKSKNYSRDKYGCYHIEKSDRDRIRSIIKKQECSQSCDWPNCTKKNCIEKVNL
jgi:hypothetical protein